MRFQLINPSPKRALHIKKRKREPKGKVYVRSNKNIRAIAHNNAKKKRKTDFKVQVNRNEKWITLGAFMFKSVAIDYAKSMAAKFRAHSFRVITE